MRRGPLAAVLAVAGALAAPASAEVSFVAMEFDSFSPARLDLLVGDSVNWRNGSLRAHDVASDVAGFDSGRVEQGGSFAHTFEAAGTFPYVCRMHDPMKGQVTVHPLLLSGPRGVVASGAPVALHVRAPAGVDRVTIEEDRGLGFRQVGTATPLVGHGHEGQEPGTLHATVRPAASAFYRAVSDAGASPSLRVEVTDEVRLALASKGRPDGAVLRARSTPAQPRARVVLQVHLRERFGWWTVQRSRLDRRSRARFVLRGSRRVLARVALVGADWVTKLAVSRPVVVIPRRG
jgi:plastocyanin